MLILSLQLRHRQTPLKKKQSTPRSELYIAVVDGIYGKHEAFLTAFASSFNLAISSCRNKHETLSICLPDSLSDSANLTLKSENVKPYVKLFESGLILKLPM